MCQEGKKLEDKTNNWDLARFIDFDKGMIDHKKKVDLVGREVSHVEDAV